MSRVGKKPITLPEGVSVELNGRELVVKGKLGVETIVLMDSIDLKIDDRIVNIVINGDENNKQNRAAHGLHRALVANMVTGVSQGFEKNIEIVGVGYRAQQQNADVVFQLGFSHNITFASPDGVAIEVVDPTKLKVKGINKQKVGQVAANIRKLKPPEPYKGKGIRYAGELVRKKAGKSGKK